MDSNNNNIPSSGDARAYEKGTTPAYPQQISQISTPQPAPGSPALNTGIKEVYRSSSNTAARTEASSSSSSTTNAQENSNEATPARESSNEVAPAHDDAPSSHEDAAPTQEAKHKKSGLHFHMPHPHLHKGKQAASGGHASAAPDHEGAEDEYFKDLSIEDALAKLETSTQGLSSSEAEARLTKYGHNALEDNKRNPVKIFFGFMWNPLSWAMEVAAALSIILGDYLDFALILALLLLNSTIAYYEESQAGNAIEALKAQLASKTSAKRDGVFKVIDSANLVPGDIIRLKIGDVAPADVKLLAGESMKVDQSALTGESLPVAKKEGDEVYSGSVIKAGEHEAVVHSTGSHTFFGRTASLVAQTVRRGHFQQILKQIGLFCIGFILVFFIAEIIVQFVARNNPCKLNGSESGCPTLLNAIILIVGGIPVAMPTVLSVTMAIGAAQLAKRQAIVRRLTAMEELAGMDILCSDKTGTLTLNKLTVDHPVAVSGFTPEQVLLDSCLASKQGEEAEDAIDVAIYGTMKERVQELQQFKVTKFIPFDPVSKRTTATVQAADGKIFYASKGAPQIILDMSSNRAEIAEQIEQQIEELAGRGLRCIGVARAEDPQGQNWVMSGLVPLFDPPREDTQETIETALKLGVRVKMITGDQLAIAKETARRLGMGQNIFTAKLFHDRTAEEKKEAISGGKRRVLPKGAPLSKITQEIVNADGFSQVYPEHKFEIVQRLQEARHTVGMTGDGVNDAPALKRADIGIAVAGATDAARAAADIVLLSPGLHVIIDALVGSRKTFQRMKNYAMYSVATTVRIVLTFSIITFAWNFYFPTIAIVLITIFNDGTILTISKDRVKPSPEPDKWNLKEVFAIAVALGAYLAGMTIVLFAVTYNSDFWLRFGFNRTLDDTEIRGLIYLYVSISGQATIFVTRTRKFFWQNRPAYILLGAFVLAQVIATFIGVYGLGNWPKNGRQDFGGCGWGFALVAWVWSIITFLPMDFIKLFITSVLFGKAVHHVHLPHHLRKNRKPKEEKAKMVLSPSSSRAPNTPGLERGDRRKEMDTIKDYNPSAAPAPAPAPYEVTPSPHAAPAPTPDPAHAPSQAQPVESQ
eukprot:TRINITY_DN92_c0_g1_i5.p1 TRINITY_DN92_c0_g1~~TRINITY_DN92_c0_g1_i5.p1  ORF type:complete len:1096 (+),score=356.01 TRINITY_DN92_c0_g1_i5:213-3500(+)